MLPGKDVDFIYHPRKANFPALTPVTKTLGRLGELRHAGEETGVAPRDTAVKHDPLASTIQAHCNTHSSIRKQPPIGTHIQSWKWLSLNPY